MANNGTFTEIQKGGQYRKGNYTFNGTTRTGIHVFTSLGKSKQKIVPLISTSWTSLSAMNPNSSIASATDVVAKINGNVFNYPPKAGPIGINYEGSNGHLYIGGTVYSAPPENSYTFKDPKFSPCFCLKSDGTATIRWFADATEMQYAMDACDCIIASTHALVFGGKVVTEETVRDNESLSLILYNVSNPSNQDDTRFDIKPNKSGPNERATRTLFGHKSGSQGIYLLVCSDSSMTIRESANLMKCLGCDYAVNLDGAGSVQMRIKNGYGPSGVSGKVTSASGGNIYAGIAVYDI